MKLSNKLYDCIKYFCAIVSPAICTLFVTLNSLWCWGLPVEAIVGTITAVTTFLGVVLGISSASYKKGDEE